MHIFKLLFSLLTLLLLAVSFGAGEATAKTYLPGDQALSHSELVSLFQNSGNAYLSSNAETFANMSYHVESGGHTGVYNGSCCTGLMQMNQTNLANYCGCSKEEYAAMSGAQQIAVYSEYLNDNLNYDAVKQLVSMQQQGQTLGGQRVDAAMVAACIQLGPGNCQKSINNGCSGVSTAEGGDGSNNICTMAAKANNGGGETANSGSGSCLAAHPVVSPVVFSEFGSWNRAGVDKGNNGWHRGVDIYPKAAQGQASKGQALFATHDGKLTVGGMGLKVENGQFRTLYLHSGSMPEAREVKAGEEIGKIGDKKAAGKPHLHFEVQVPKSAVTATKCIIGQETNDCAFPVVPGEKPKRDPNGYATSQSLASASPKAWFYVNPERYLKERVPVQGSATARTGRTESLPNSCTPGTSVAETPTSAGESENTAALAGGFGDYLSGHGSGVANADKELRSIVIDMTRQSALDVRAATSSAAQMQARFDAAAAGLLSLYGRAGE